MRPLHTPNPAGAYALTGNDPASHDRLAGFIAAGILWILLILMIVPEGFDYSLLLTGRNPNSASLLTRLLWLGLLGGGAVLVLWRASLSLMLVRQVNPFLIAFVVLALLSAAWSIEPRITIRRDVRLVTMMLVCIAFAVIAWHPRRLQNVVRPLLTLVLLGSVVFGVVAPELAIHQDKSPELLNAWRGLTNHKNSLGALAGVTALFWYHAWLAREVRAIRAMPALALAGACIYLSRSATALIATLFAAVILTMLTNWPKALQPYLKYAVAIVVTALVVYALAILGLIPGRRILFLPITALTGDTTFTGRSEIWAIMTDEISKHPLLGLGYGAYWVGPDPRSPSYDFIVKMFGFYPGSAHSGYLEITNELGWVGLLCLIGYLVTHIRQTLRLWPVDRSQAALFLTLFMQQAVSNLSESHWLSVLSVHFVLMTLVSVALARRLVDHRLQTRMAFAQQRFAKVVPMRARPYGVSG